MYGMGYGLAKMGEGVTSGMAKGSLVNMMMSERKQARQEKLTTQQATQDYRTKALELQERHIDNKEDAATISRTMNAVTQYLNVLEKSGNHMAAKGVYEVMDPGGEIPDITLKDEDELTVDFKGLKLVGDKEAMRQAIEIMAKNPKVTPQILGKLVELDLADIVIPEEKEPPEAQKPFTVAPRSGVWDPKTSKFLVEPTVKEDKEEKPELTPSQALRRISDIRKAREALGGTSIVTGIMAQHDPALANRINNRLSETERKALLKAWNDEINYLKKFTPQAGTGTLGAMMNPQGGVGYKAPPGAQKTTRAVYDANTGGFSYR